MQSEGVHDSQQMENEAAVALGLVKKAANQQVVAVASSEALAAGVRPGMSLAEACALCPGLAHAPWEPDRDVRALETLGHWMMRFSPIVCPDVFASGPAGRIEAPKYAILLDLTGCEQAFGGLCSLIEQIEQSMRQMRVHARLAVAPTPGAAWALALAGQKNRILVSQERVAQALSPLPPIALRIPGETARLLDQLGIQTIGQLMRLPRESLPSRFGPMLLQRLDQALGLIPEPLAGLKYESPIEAGMDFDGPVDSPEAIRKALSSLIGQISQELARRGVGARWIELRLDRSHSPAVVQMIRLMQPSREPANLFKLLWCAVENLEQAAERQSGWTIRRQRGQCQSVRSALSFESMAPAGFLGIRVRVCISEAVGQEQIWLLDQEEHTRVVELDQLIERLVLRLGNQGISQANLVESHIPERAYELIRPETQRKHPCRKAAKGPGAFRPLHLLNRPMEIGVMVSPSHDCEGRPISFTANRQVHRLTLARGPERIGGQWWQGQDRTRDYFDVEDESGRRFWIFRVRETGKWYWHGIFE